MKKCEYCGKEITYFEQYCGDDCQRNANKFYEMREKHTGVFSVINCICVFGIPVGIFLFPMVNSIGFTLATVCTIILGLTILALPFPTEGMIQKRKIKKAIDMTRIFGLILLGIGLVCLVIDLIMFI